MTGAPPCDFCILRSGDGESAFFACMGRFFACPEVRRDCGGYPLNDGPAYLWFVARRRCDGRVLGFVSIEQGAGIVRIRHGYVVPEARGLGLFRQLRRQVLAHIDDQGVRCATSVPLADLPFLAPWGFRLRHQRGGWVTLERTVNARVEPPHP
ncbi:transcriptional regulator [Delftia sp. PS-11]|uniref:transcriptional regulator n=1 Tax=Delftia sp. PS-11 TaxID=2767222 RepID=UPI002458B701|nr:transcriptional regulator [Delftia sp. PS-11]KAJ8740787.1 transcriptional regulator [Delftia sp. PS-11]